MLSLLPSIAAAAPADPLGKLQFLIGSWTTDGVTGSTTFERSLKDHVILRKSWVDVPASNGHPAARHEDLIVIFPYGNAVRAAYYDSDGYVVGYDVQSKGKNEVVMVSDKLPGVPRARLTYKLGSGGTLAANMELAPAEKQDAFAPGLAWNSHKTK